MDDRPQWHQFLDEHKISIGCAAVGTVLLLSGVFSSGILSKPVKTSSYKAPAQAQAIVIDVSGAVSALKAAGGATEQADTGYIAKNLNLAQKVTDGMKLYVPYANESVQVMGVSTKTSVTSGPVSLNNGTLEQLDSLSGVGAVTAQKIIDARPISSVEQLVSKKIISKSVYDKIKDHVSL
jgi:DNA uptake protein ComE-like DNA-binding protein